MLWRPKISMSGREAISGWLLASPWVVGFLAFTLIPMVASVYISLSDYDSLVWPPSFIGLQNYDRMLTSDPLVVQAIKVTFTYALVTTPVYLVVSFLVALLLNQKVRFLAFWRTLFYLPAVMTGVAVALLWAWILNPEFGLVNWVLDSVTFGNLSGPAWLIEPRLALWAIAMMGLWGVGGGMLIYLAGLQGVPSELYEASDIDGAGELRKFWHITVPQLTPVILFNLIIGMIGHLQLFTQPFIMTGGGPDRATFTLLIALYQYAWQRFLMGYASALAWLIFVISLVLSLAILRFSRGWVYYAGDVRGRR